MSGLSYHRPRSLEEAVALAARFGGDARFLAGGTDLIVQLKRRRLAPRHLIALQDVPGLDAISADGTIALGATATHRAIEKAPAFAGALRCLIEGAQVIGGHQVRNVGTVGGNLVNASPAADLNPCLAALDGEVTLLGPDGERQLAIVDFLRGPNETARRPDELLTRVTLPGLPPRSATAFLKAGRRRAMEIAVVCVAVRLTLDAGAERCVEARIALGAVAPTTVRARAAERLLEGRPATADVFREAAESAREASAPIGDVRASADFRRHLTAVLVRRALERCAGRVRATA